MKQSLRATLAVGMLALAGGIAWAAGVNGIFDLNRDGTQGIIEDLQDDKASFTASSDLARLDAAIATLQAAPETPLTQTTSVKALQKAISQLGPLGTNTTVAPQLAEAVGTLYFQVYGYNATAASSAAGYYNTHRSFSDLKKYAGLVKQFAGRIAKLESTVGTGAHAAWPIKKKLALFLSVCKAGDALIKKYGPPPA